MEQLLMDKGLGRFYAPDERDNAYLLRELTGPASLDSLPAYKYWSSPYCLDQGATPKCTAFSAKTLLMNNPVRQIGEHPTTDEIYTYAQNNDAWPGTDYEGSSVRAAMKALVYYTTVTTYRWAFTLDDAVRWVSLYGTLNLGTDWHKDMSRPYIGSDGRSWIEPTGTLQGGHAYLLNGVNREQGKFRMENNWGREWGDNGFAWISFDSVEYLLSQNGEAACPTEVMI